MFSCFLNMHLLLNKKPVLVFFSTGNFCDIHPAESGRAAHHDYFPSRAIGAPALHAAFFEGSIDDVQRSNSFRTLLEINTN